MDFSVYKLCTVYQVADLVFLYFKGVHALFFIFKHKNILRISMRDNEVPKGA